MKLPKGNGRYSDRQQHWKAVIAEQKQSGQTVESFCQQRGVTQQSFYQWRKRLGAAQAPVRFALVATGKPQARESAAMELVLRSGHCLRIAAGVDGATLRTVLEVLEARA
jgi:transposase-like protein